MIFLCQNYSKKHSAGCFNSKPDVLKWLCDLDSELLVFWLSLVWSWVMEIYAWSIIWNFFDLRKPQQPQIKSIKIQSCFYSFIVQIFINFLLNQSLYDSMYAVQQLAWSIQHFWKELMKISTTQNHTMLNQKTNNSESKSHDHFKTLGFEL